MMNDKVKRGTELLDRKAPGWWKSIDLGELNLRLCTKCILGQLYGYYSTGLTVLEIPPSNTPDEDIAFGFCLHNGHSALAWAALTELWVQEINSRREKDKQGEVA